MTMRTPLLYLATLLVATSASAQSVRTIDIPTRPAVTQRILVITPDKPRAAVILFAGGDGGLTLEADGRIPKLAGNFLVRSRQQFADQGLTTVVIDAPSDRQSPPYLSGSRQTAEHVADVKAVIAWLREQSPDIVTFCTMSSEFGMNVYANNDYCDYSVWSKQEFRDWLSGAGAYVGQAQYASLTAFNTARLGRS